MTTSIKTTIPHNNNNNNIIFKWKSTLQLFTTTLLSLLLPLSFLLLARIATAGYLSYRIIPPPVAAEPPPAAVFFSLLTSTPLTPLHILITIISVATLVNTFPRGVSSSSSFSPAVSSTAALETAVKPQLYTAWIILCSLQICVGLGIEGSIVAGVEGCSFGHERNLLCRVVFFLGLHMTTEYWRRTVVKPVVDDTVFGFEVAEGWVERVAMGGGLGGLWWWRLRDEVEALVAVTVVKAETVAGATVVDLMGWWLYYLVVVIGIVRVVKCFVWCGVVLIYQKVEQVKDDDDCSLNVDEKV